MAYQVLERAFVSLTLQTLYLGQTCINTFYYGLAEGGSINDIPEAATVADALIGYFVGETDPSLFTLQHYRVLWPGTAQVQSVKVLVKGATTVPPVEVGEALSLVGTRPAAGELYPPNVTASAYAPRLYTLGKGAISNWSGVTEADYNGGTGFTNTATQFKDLVSSFLLMSQADGAFLNPLTGYTLVPAVVKRIKYTTTAGKTAYRLPLDPLDSPDVFPIGAWGVRSFAGSQNLRKIPPAGS